MKPWSASRLAIQRSWHAASIATRFATQQTARSIRLFHRDHETHDGPMIVTTTRSCLLRQTRLYTRRKPVAIRPRTFFSSAGPGASQSPGAAADLTTPTFRILAPLIDELDKLAPRFEINPNQIQILREPKDFYATLKVCIPNLNAALV